MNCRSFVDLRGSRRLGYKRRVRIPPLAARAAALLITAGLLMVAPSPARAFGDAGAFDPRVLLTGSQAGAARATAAARWAWELVQRTSAPARLHPSVVHADDPAIVDALLRPVTTHGGLTPAEEELLGLIAERKKIDIRDVMVVMLDRERHQAAMEEIRDAGARVRLILDGDVSAALLAVSDNTPVDILWGIGGTPEGVISAAAIKCIGGQMLGRLWPRDDSERDAAVAAGYDLSKILNCDDLVAGEDVFFSATGVTDGDVLQGVRYQGDRGATTESLVMRSRSGTVRRVSARHDRAKLRTLTGVRYG